MTPRRTLHLLGLFVVLGGPAAARAQDKPAAGAATGTASAGASAGASAPAASGAASAAAAAAPAPSGAPAAGAPAAPAGAPPAGAAPATPAGAPPGSAPPAAGATGEGGYTVRLRALERSVNELKEQVFRTKARLNQLKETVLGGVIGASRGQIQFKNEMGGSFRLIKAVFALDGVQIFNKADDSGRLAEMKEFDIYNGAIQPGSHTLTVQLIYQGHGFGVFSYLKGYKFNVRSSHTFAAGEGKHTKIAVVGFEKGGMTTNMEDKPAIDFRMNIMNPEGTAAGKK